ncbi:hypothetical protein DVR12_06385 [Chitinophaga silvatica]|uniref:Lipoprotein n=1 Tax=Chitinophaga silvatica TaxID=2282649 RepID=A0A3E1YE82_9BACT|nr:hypothetical protein [Chitinophaga silvatica]RFS24818.1 hypothetical protein DVR12_06385 [Chitinophaga silvatica]
MKRFFLVLLTIGVFAACKTKKGTGQDNEPMTFDDFQALFTPGTLPYRLTPDSLLLKTADSLALDSAGLSFLTDTLSKGDFDRGTRVKYFPLQKIKGNLVDYFAVKATSKSEAKGYLCFLDKKGKYLNKLRVADTGSDDGVIMSLNLDAKNVIKISSETKVAGGKTALKEDFYMVNADGSTTLIMTNSNGPTTAAQIFNPIDTLPRKHKFSGDYTAGDMSILSIRDGNDGKTFLFFISFSKDNGNCKGELSGKGEYLPGNKGEYNDKGSACGLSFQFSSTHVSIKEIGGCGAYRGIKCFFEGSFAKKIEKKKKKA